jgi:hypothetical protein
MSELINIKSYCFIYLSDTKNVLYLLGILEENVQIIQNYSILK